MNNQPDVGLVDAHAERTGGNHHIKAIVQKGLESGGATALGEARMIGLGPVTGGAQGARDRFGDPTGGDIDDRHPVISSEEIEQRPQPLALTRHLNDTEPEIGSIERPQVNRLTVR